VFSPFRKVEGRGLFSFPLAEWKFGLAYPNPARGVWGISLQGRVEKRIVPCCRDYNARWGDDKGLYPPENHSFGGSLWWGYFLLIG